MNRSKQPGSVAVAAFDPALLRCVHVELGARGYDVLIGPGLIGQAGRLIAQHLGPARAAMVADLNVEAAGHLATLESNLSATAIALGAVVLTPGEATKCFRELEVTIEELLRLGLERRDVVIALGGGVIGDLTGFAASVLRRGVRFVQIPTTLLAQVDSSVGGKTAINSPQGKNLIGAFHQPSLVLADTDALASLPHRQMRAGYAEIVKHALLGDPTYFAWLEQNGAAVLARDTPSVVHAVARSVEMKAEIVARDETEQGDRMLLNLGHTFGHALEAWAGFSDRLLHGEAVAIGTAIALRFSESLGLCPPGTAARASAHLASVGLPTGINDIGGNSKPEVGELLRLMAQDKKVSAGRMTFILVRGIGQAFVSRDIETAQVEAALTREIAR